MSTRSCIIIKLKKGDIGKPIKFDINMLPNKVVLDPWLIKDPRTGKIWCDERGKEKSKTVIPSGRYMAIYCHWCGSMTEVGCALKEKFSDYDKALNLLAGGFCSEIGSESVKHYANRKREEWEDVQPRFGNSPSEIILKMGQQYNYLLDENGWRCFELSSKKSIRFGKY